jgi:hypothetical protein
MKDHPDEFLMQRKWYELIEHYGEYFTEEELNAYKAARSEMMRDLFNEAVLKRLAGEEDDGKTLPSTMKYSTQGRYALGTADPRAMYGQSLMNNPSAYNAAIEQRLYSEQRGLQQQAYNDIGFNPFV